MFIQYFINAGLMGSDEANAIMEVNSNYLLQKLPLCLLKHINVKHTRIGICMQREIQQSAMAFLRSMGKCKKDVTLLLTHWSYVFPALTHRDCDTPSVICYDLVWFLLYFSDKYRYNIYNNSTISIPSHIGLICHFDIMKGKHKWTHTWHEVHSSCRHQGMISIMVP